MAPRPGPTSGRGSRTPWPPTARGGRWWADDRTTVRRVERARQPLEPRAPGCSRRTVSVVVAHYSSSRSSSTARWRRWVATPAARRGRGRRRRVAPATGRPARRAAGAAGRRRIPRRHPLSATSAWPRPPVTCWCCWTPTRPRSLTSSSAWWPCPRPCPRPWSWGAAGTPTSRAPRRSSRSSRSRRRSSCPSPPGCATRTPPAATCWTPTPAATASSSARSWPAAGGGTTRSAASTRRSAPTAGRTGTSPTGRGPRAACWRTGPMPSPGTTAPTRERGSTTPAHAWPRPWPSPTARPAPSTTWRGLARGPADVAVTCAPALADAELLVTRRLAAGRAAASRRTPLRAAP